MAARRHRPRLRLKGPFTLSCLVGAICAAGAVQAHHSYAMFDGAQTRSVTGTVARLEWKNPHVFLWIYVPSQVTPRTHQLWAFENGSPSVLSARGWSASLFKAGDRITVDYWPLRSGGNGGHVEKVDLAGGRTLVGAGGPPRPRT